MNETLFEQAVRAILAKAVPMQVTEGTVTAVDKGERTCTVERDDLPTLFDVRLNATLNPGDNLVTIFPKSGSRVLCALVEGQPTDAFVLTATEPEEVSGKVGEVSLRWNAEGVILNGGKLGGLVKAKELETQLSKLTARVDGIIGALNGGVPVAQDGGAALIASIKSALATLTDKENFTSLENEKVKH